MYEEKEEKEHHDYEILKQNNKQFMNDVLNTLYKREDERNKCLKELEKVQIELNLFKKDLNKLIEERNNLRIQIELLKKQL